jgi:hypothetical protein
MSYSAEADGRFPTLVNERLAYNWNFSEAKEHS